MEVYLTFHGLGRPPASVPEHDRRYWLAEEQFAHILELIRRAPNRVHITFDDGNDTDVRIALPALRKAGFSAAFFIPSDRIGKPGYLKTTDIRDLRAAGMTIGSHGSAHIRWTDVQNEVIAADVTRSLDRLGSILREEIRDVAVPFGACDRRVLNILRGLGVRRVYTSFNGSACEGRWLVRRNTITYDLPEAAVRELLAKKCTLFEKAVASLRLWRKVGQAAFW